MKKTIGVLLALSSFSIYADQIVSGTNMNGRSLRSYVESGEVVIAKCKSYSVHEIKSKCEEVSKKTFQSREHFMQQALYNLVTYGSQDKERQSLIEKIRKMKNNKENEGILAEKQKELDILNKKIANIESFGKQSGTEVKYSSEYQDTQSVISETKKQIEALSGQTLINKEGQESLHKLASSIATTYEQIANNDTLVIEKENSKNDELIELLMKNETKDLSNIGQFKSAKDFSIDEILTQKCSRKHEKLWQRTEYKVNGYMKLPSVGDETYESFELYVGDNSDDLVVKFAAYSYTKRQMFYSGQLSELDYSDNYELGREAFIDELLNNSSACHDTSKISMVTGKMSLEELEKTQPIQNIRVKVQALAPLKMKGVNLTSILQPIKVKPLELHISNEQRGTVKEEKRGLFGRIFKKNQTSKK